MKIKTIQNLMKYLLPALFILIAVSTTSYGQNSTNDDTKKKKREVLEHLLSTFTSNIEGEVPVLHPVWESWLQRTGELLPDFDQLPTNAFPPDLLTFENGNPVTDSMEWLSRREEMIDELKKYNWGNWPPHPEKIAIKYQDSIAEETDVYTKHNVQLWFGPSVTLVEYAQKNQPYNPELVPENRNDRSHHTLAIVNVELFIPKGEGPFPAIVEPGPVRSRDFTRLERGYIVARFSRLDADYISAVYPDYECNQLEWWAYAASRCVDLLYSRDDVDTSKIVQAGHSRGAKQAMIAVLMDRERVNAFINSHPGTGSGSYNLWRYATEKYGGEHLENSSRRFPYWNNPRMLFFMGRTNKMPFDSHFLQALAAPIPTLMGTGERDEVGQPWGDQQCYLAVKEVYKILGKEQNLGFYPSPGGHAVTEKMVEDHLDWLDMQFGRKPFTFKENLIYTYTFDDWQKLTGEEFNKDDFPEKDLDDILQMPEGGEVKKLEDWEIKTDHIKDQILSVIGDLPDYDTIEKIRIENERKFRKDFIKADINIDNKLTAHITYPADRREKMPVVIYLHAYLDASGYDWPRDYLYRLTPGERLAQDGFLAVEFNQFGYANRNRDSGIEFYEENPELSALGVMIQDVRKVIDAISLTELADEDKIMLAGYSLGGMVGLYSAVFDERIKAISTSSGFGSMRMDAHGNQTEGIKRYSHLRPTIPRLGLFLGNEKRIPYDFHEVLALIAPRPVHVLAPKLDQDWFYEDVEICYQEAQKIFKLYGKENNLVLESPNDFNRYPPEYQQMVNEWLSTLVTK